MRFIVCTKWYIVCSERFIVYSDWYIVCSEWYAICSKQFIIWSERCIVCSERFIACTECCMISIQLSCMQDNKLLFYCPANYHCILVVHVHVYHFWCCQQVSSSRIISQMYSVKWRHMIRYWFTYSCGKIKRYSACEHSPKFSDENFRHYFVNVNMNTFLFTCEIKKTLVICLLRNSAYLLSKLILQIFHPEIYEHQINWKVDVFSRGIQSKVHLKSKC